MSERQMPTYYPGDVVELEIEIKHKVNFRNVVVTFVGRRDPDDQVALRAQIDAGEVVVQETWPDGTKRSTLHIMKVASRNDWAPGLVYELAEVQGQTIGPLPGESKHGSFVEFDLGGIIRPRFRFEEEAGQLHASVSSALLLD